ncbi:MAG: hypothetical protein R3F43_30370 [bacterium]
MRGQKSRSRPPRHHPAGRDAALSREIPFAISGFQDVLIPWPTSARPGTRRARTSPSSSGNSSAPGGRQQQAQLQRRRPLPAGRHADQLITHPASHRILIVVSDGLPSAPSSVNDLKKAVLVLKDPDVPVELIGLGLGPNTGHVTQFYPEARANISVDRFSTRSATLIEKIVLE